VHVFALLAALVLAPPIVWKPVPFGPQRLADAAAYSQRHYGQSTWRLTSPKVIVHHYTANTSLSATWNAFASNAPDAELHERPGTCAHFVIDRDGRVYQLVRLSVRCRHTVGLNWTAIGIEHVGQSDAQVMGNRRQLAASLRLTRALQGRFGIATRNVIGHNESRESPYHRERVARLRTQTHADFPKAVMDGYRRRLERLPAPASLR
jgi:beta-N-acetylhexosaminidase